MYKQIRYSEAKELIDKGDIVIADVRDEASFNKEHIRGAVHLSMKALNAFCESNPNDVAILVYCYHGISSQSVAQHLADKGFTAVYSLIGGFEAWKLQYTSDTSNS